MKRFLCTVLAALSAFAIALGLTACGKDTDADKNGENKTLYSIQSPASSDAYTVSGLPERAYAGDAISFKVTLTDPENSTLQSVMLDSAELTAGADGAYSFTMPAKAVTVQVEVKTFSEKRSDGGVTFSDKNLTEIAAGSANDWTFTIGLDWSSYGIGSGSYAISSNQSVIPDDAIVQPKPADDNPFSSVTVQIDPAGIAPGKTWLEIHIRDNSIVGKQGTVCVQITVVAGEIEYQTMDVTFTYENKSGYADKDIFSTSRT